MDGLLIGRAALVASGAGRIGCVIGATLAREGTQVVITDRAGAKLEQTGQELGAPVVAGDVTDPASATAIGARHAPIRQDKLGEGAAGIQARRHPAAAQPRQTEHALPSVRQSRPDGGLRMSPRAGSTASPVSRR